MNLSHLTNEALLAAIQRIGKEMTSASNTRNNALEKDRIIYIKELFKRGLGGYPSKRKYRL